MYLVSSFTVTLLLQSHSVSKHNTSQSVPQSCTPTTSAFWRLPRFLTENWEHSNLINVASAASLAFYCMFYKAEIRIAQVLWTIEEWHMYDSIGGFQKAEIWITHIFWVIETSQLFTKWPKSLLRIVERLYLTNSMSNGMFLSEFIHKIWSRSDSNIGSSPTRTQSSNLAPEQ